MLSLEDWSAGRWVNIVDRLVAIGRRWSGTKVGWVDRQVRNVSGLERWLSGKASRTRMSQDKDDGHAASGWRLAVTASAVIQAWLQAWTSSAIDWDVVGGGNQFSCRLERRRRRQKLQWVGTSLGTAGNSYWQEYCLRSTGPAALLAEGLLRINRIAES